MFGTPYTLAGHWVYVRRIIFIDGRAYLDGYTPADNPKGGGSSIDTSLLTVAPPLFAPWAVRRRARLRMMRPSVPRHLTPPLPVPRTHIWMALPRPPFYSVAASLRRTQAREPNTEYEHAQS